ncbi:cupin domain-containing protein [Cellulomonas sp. McL0617]|uniref:cupin domain-containing protein n=1 Tax=Cellulomonas sp. McL0617 TaxID=3415675 RepID=UPI003CF9708A
MHLVDTASSGGPQFYVEHLRVPSMSVGTAVLGVGAVDSQQPHTEDEIYVVLRGRARLWTPSLTVDVAPGSVAFVPASEEHRFVDVVDELHVLVVFAPAEYGNATGQLLRDPST